MENTNKNLIHFIVVMTLVLGFSLVVPNFAYAMRSGETTVRSGVTFNSDPAINNNTNWLDTLNQGVKVANPVPSIFSISPNSWNINKGTTTVTITGTNFIPNSFVRFNNIDHTTTYINSGTLQFKLNTSDISTVGNFPIVVANMGPGGGLSNVITINLNRNQNATGTTNTNNGTSYKNTDSNGNDLSANALFGANGFIPSTFLQWVAVFILILLIVVLWRKLYVSDKDKAEPLKHH